VMNCMVLVALVDLVDLICLFLLISSFTLSISQF